MNFKLNLIKTRTNDKISSEFIEDPAAQDMTGGEPLLLSCKISGSSQVTVTWKKDGQDVSAQEDVYSQQDSFAEEVTTSTLSSSNAGSSMFQFFFVKSVF